MIEEYGLALIGALFAPSVVSGLLVWWFKRSIERKDKAKEDAARKREQEKDEREQRVEELMLLIMKETRATNILATATAKAVQRIPDAKCNGDMHAALEEAARIQCEEKDFLVTNGIKHIFGKEEGLT